jgi:hypothetical protein
MKTSLKLLAFLFAFSAGISSLAAATPNLSKPTAKYWHLWVDSDGKSHMTQCAMGDFVLQSMNKPADPQWQDRQSGNGRVIFTIQPAQWKGTWHEDPKVQWVVPLDGTWFVEAQDGTRAEMGPGVAFLGEDLQTKPDAQGRKGHLSGNIGDGPVTLIVVQTDAMPTRNQPCHVK